MGAEGPRIPQRKREAMAEVSETPLPVRVLDMRVIAAFAAIYLVWGSTFLVIRYAVETIPPLLLVGMRSVCAGAILYAWAWQRGEARLGWREWRIAAVGGFFFFVVSHGSLAWAEQYVPSGVAAVVLALIPAWVVLLDWLRPGGSRPTVLVLAGVLLGFVGLLLLVGPQAVSEGFSSNVIATVVLATGAMGWAFGTVFTRYTKIHASPIATSAMQLLSGGAMLFVAGSLAGEWPALIAHPPDRRSLLSLLYLILMGSVVTFSAYIWLLRTTSPARVATYAYVNPLVAVLLGWLFAGEVITAQILAASVLIIGAVALVITVQGRRTA